MKLFNRKPKFQEVILDFDVVFTKLDKLMSDMASKEIHKEYIKLRKVIYKEYLLESQNLLYSNYYKR